ncbi:VanZ family protein [Puniceicoccaceae bacterium K14]|nr:VanZ family protein [Puniceicoccaceae bacterium K14]
MGNGKNTALRDTMYQLRVWLPIIVAYGTILFLATARANSGAPPPSLSIHDKVQHFIFYGLVGTLLQRAMPLHLKRITSWVIAFSLTAALGLIDEICQHYNPGRTGDPLDWFADCLGGLTGILLYNWVRPYRRFVEFSPLKWALARISPQKLDLADFTRSSQP